MRAMTVTGHIEWFSSCRVSVPKAPIVAWKISQGAEELKKEIPRACDMAGVESSHFVLTWTRLLQPILATFVLLLRCTCHNLF